jgi:hypothetical protein
MRGKLILLCEEGHTRLHTIKDKDYIVDKVGMLVYKNGTWKYRQKGNGND